MNRAHRLRSLIPGKMMEHMRASRGDVAESASGNANLQKMMADMRLEGLMLGLD